LWGSSQHPKFEERNPQQSLDALRNRAGLARASGGSGWLQAPPLLLIGPLISQDLNSRRGLKPCTCCAELLAECSCDKVKVFCVRFANYFKRGPFVCSNFT
jgi:hypothetical protein